MKTGRILEKASIMATGEAPDELMKKAGVGFINTILSDICKTTVLSLSEDIELTPLEESAVVSGVAMLICTYFGDDAGLSVMSDTYNGFRKRLLGRVGSVRNTLFGGGEL